MRSLSFLVTSLGAFAFVACGGGGENNGAASAEPTGNLMPMPSQPMAPTAGTPTVAPPASTQAGPAPFACPIDPGTLNLEAAVSEVMDATVSADGFAPDFSILEGPVWAEGALYFSHFAGDNPPPGRIYRLVPGTPVEVFKTDAGSNGLALDQSGDLLAARHLDGSVSRIAMGDGAVTAIAGEYMGNVFNSPNDLAQRSDGNIYFTDPNYQKPDCDDQPAHPSCPRQGDTTGIYRIDPQGAVSAIDISRQNPNGIHLSLDENTLFVTGNMPLTRYAVMADGSLGAGQSVPGGEDIQGDGMGLDCLGNLYVAIDSEVRIINSETGAAVGSLSVGDQATNVAFGGPNRSTLYITTLGNNPGLYAAEVGVVGLPY
jgi:gluconolactonase